MRPLFPKGYDRETQIIVTVLSADRDNDSDMLSLIAASAALLVSDIPHKGPVASVRMGRVDGKIVVNPTHTELEGSDVSLVVAASPESIMMLEGGAQIVDEEVILEALFAAHEAMQPIFAMQEELQRRAGKPKREFAVKERGTALPPASSLRSVGCPASDRRCADGRPSFLGLRFLRLANALNRNGLART